VPGDVDANNLASMEDSIYCSSSSSSSTSKDMSDFPSDTPPEGMETEPHEADPNPVTKDVAMLDSANLPLQSVGDQ